MNNAIWNSSNIYQTNVPKILCVCSAGLLRSPTMANVIHEVWGFNTRAVGIDVNYALIPINEQLLHWADIIICVERGHKEGVRDFMNKVHFSDEKQELISLAIPDNFEWNNEELRQAIEKQVTVAFKESCWIKTYAQSSAH